MFDVRATTDLGSLEAPAARASPKKRKKKKGKGKKEAAPAVLDETKHVAQMSPFSLVFAGFRCEIN